MSKGYTTPQDRSRRRKATAVVVVGVVLVVGWIAAIAAFAGGSNGSRQGGAEGAASDSSGQQQASANAASADASAGTTAEQESESSSESATQPSTTDQGEAPEGGQTDPQQAGTTEAQTQQVFDPLEEDNGGSGGQPDGSSEGEQAGQTGLSETDTTRARAASERYIVAAYGYTVDSKTEYLEGIEQAASEEIYDSPGGKMLEGYAKAAPECGMRSTAILEEFEVLGKSPEGFDVSVTFTVEDADGETHTFRQDQRLSSTQGGYEVSGVSVEELTSDTTPTESCPGAKPKESGSGNPEAEVKPDETGVADEDRAKAAADRYITSAYGYTGNSASEYREGIARTADTQSLYRSPGGKQIRDYERAAEKDGITAAAVMERVEITATEGSTIEGTAYFRVGKEYDRYGELKGESTPFKVDLTLSPVRSTYEVSSSSVERETSDSGEAGPEKKTR